MMRRKATKIRKAFNLIPFDESIVMKAELKATGMDIHTVKSCLESYGLFWKTAKMMVEMKEESPAKFRKFFTDAKAYNEMRKAIAAEKGIRMFLAGVPLKEAWIAVGLK